MIDDVRSVFSAPVAVSASAHAITGCTSCASFPLNAVAEVFTGTPGVFVKLEDTVRSFAAICKGEYDHLPEAAFYMVGTIEEAVKKAETLKAAA